MKKDIHPQDYRLVVFHDTSSDFKILTRSTTATSEKIKWEDGNEYPLIKVHVSSASHPFYTGEEKVLDIEGRVDKFKARSEAAQKAKEQKQAKAAATSKKLRLKKRPNQKLKLSLKQILTRKLQKLTNRLKKNSPPSLVYVICNLYTL